MIGRLLLDGPLLSSLHFHQLTHPQSSLSISMRESHGAGEGTQEP